MNILLLGCGGNAGINFIKSLKMADSNLKIIGLDLDKYNLISSNCDEKILLTFKNKEEKIDKINKLIKDKNIDLIHAQPDPEVRFLCENINNLKCSIFEHSLEEWEKFANKLYCSKIWKDKLNLSFISYSLSEVLENNNLWNKLKEKNEKIWCRSIKGAGSKAALPVTKISEAEHWMQYWVNNKNCKLEDFMVSEFLPGDEYAVQTFWFNGELVQSQARQRMAYFFGNIMPSGQSSTPSVAKTIREEEVYNTAYKSIKTITDKPHGIYCVDLKRDSKNNIIPMEINYGRFFTTSDFFSSININTPYAYCKTIKDKNINNSFYKINSIEKTFYWIRGLDKEPYLCEEEEFKKQILI